MPVHAKKIYLGEIWQLEISFAASFRRRLGQRGGSAQK
jgi:hypothetical protein